MRLLLVEDDQALSESLTIALKRSGFTLSNAATGKEALLNLKFDQIDIVILDLGLPDMDGLDLLKQLRLQPSPPPVLILTARDQLEDKIKGLEQGADDYLIKPFEIKELIARLKVFERRLSGADHHLLKVGEVCLDLKGYTVTYQNNPVNLSRKEYLLLKALMESAGRIVTKEALEARLYSIDDDLASNALEVHLHHLRKKLDRSLVKTIRGVGYTLEKS